MSWRTWRPRLGVAGEQPAVELERPGDDAVAGLDDPGHDPALDRADEVALEQLLDVVVEAGLRDADLGRQLLDGPGRVRRWTIVSRIRRRVGSEIARRLSTSPMSRTSSGWKSGSSVRLCVVASVVRARHSFSIDHSKMLNDRMHAEWRLSRALLRTARGRPDAAPWADARPDRARRRGLARRARGRAGRPTAARSRGRLTFLGHSTVLIEVDDLRILTDPVLREGFGPVRRQVQAVLPELFADLDAVFISHGHHDHLDPPSLRRIPGKPTVIVPRGLPAASAEKAGLGPVEEVEPGDRLTIDRVRFEVHVRRALGTPRAARARPVRRSAASSRDRGPSTSPATPTCSPAMGELAGRLDVAMLPVWGWGPTIGEGHMDPVRAAAAAAILRPRLAIPIHWGTFYPAGMRRVAPGPFDEPGREFAAALAGFAPDLAARVLAPGESLDLPEPEG